MNYELDMKVWRCGGDEFGTNGLGSGETAMLNDQGYMCCLGQFAAQAGVGKSYLLGQVDPSTVGDALRDAKKKWRYDDSFLNGENFISHLASNLIHINDDDNTTPEQKIVLLRNELEAHGHTLSVIDSGK